MNVTTGNSNGENNVTSDHRTDAYVPRLVFTFVREPINEFHGTKDQDEKGCNFETNSFDTLNYAVFI